MTAATSSLRAIRERILTEVRNADVAVAAGIAAATWAATDYPRVFFGDTGFVGHRNRGRLPFVEVWLEGQSYDDIRNTGGTMLTRVTLRVWVGGAGTDTAETLSHDIAATALMRIRDDETDNFLAHGETQTIGTMVPGPWGHYRDVSIDIEHSYCQSTFGVWRPSMLDAYYWWDPTDASQFALSGTNVTTWTSASDTTAIILTTGSGTIDRDTDDLINARQAVRLGSAGGESNEMDADAVPYAGTSSVTLCAAVYHDTLPASSGVIFEFTGGSGSKLLVQSTGRVSYADGFGAAQMLSAAGAVVAGRTCILTVTLSGTSGTLRVDGADVETDTVVDWSNATAFDLSSTAFAPHGMLGDFIITSSVAAKDIARIEQFLAQKWSVNLG